MVAGRLWCTARAGLCRRTLRRFWPIKSESMPIYEYKCGSCGAESELLQPMGSVMSEPCSECGGKLERIPSSTSMNFGKFSSRSSERHSKVPAEQRARMEQDRLVEHSKKT